MNTKLQVSDIMLGGENVARAKDFYAGLGGEVVQDHGAYVKISLGEGSSSLVLYQWEAAAQDAGVPAEGTGFRGTSLHFTTDSRDAVDEVIRTAVAAGGTLVQEPTSAEWGGYSGYFADPDGHLWKIATAS